MTDEQPGLPGHVTELVDRVLHAASIDETGAGHAVAEGGTMGERTTLKLRPYSDDVVNYVMPSGAVDETYDTPVRFALTLPSGEVVRVRVRLGDHCDWETDVEMPAGTVCERVMS